MFDLKSARIAVIGLGYVGLPLAVAFNRKFDVIGFDTNPGRVLELRSFFDRTGEVPSSDLRAASRLTFAADENLLEGRNIFVVTVPTPVDAQKKPDLSFLKNACQTIGRYLTKGGVVVFESTIYPGVTEEICASILGEVSGLEYNVDFFCGYSPERINPGDKTRRIENIVKVTSGSTKLSAMFIDSLYREVIPAGTHLAGSIKVAEAAKVIENTQRDLNIALMNELSQIFHELEIDTQEVLMAAGTKWNFLPFVPGLVGGHCIGVDPYYLTFKATAVGVEPKIILAGRQLNDSMPQYCSDLLLNALNNAITNGRQPRIALLGVTFKENCPDIRNSKVHDLISILANKDLEFVVCDPVANADEVFNEWNVVLTPFQNLPKVDAIVLAVGHQQFLNIEIKKYANLLYTDNRIFFDLKSCFEVNDLQKFGIDVIRL